MDDPAAEGLLAVLAETRSLLARPGNEFTWSRWTDGREALAELDALIAGVRAGNGSKMALASLFAPAGPIQDVSLSSGWAPEFLALAERFDKALADWRGPYMRWLDWVAALLGLLSQAWPILFLIPWHFIARRRGLVPRRRHPGHVDLVGERVVFASESERWEVPFEQIHHIRSAENSNLAESTMLESGMTFFAATGRRLAYVGASAAGFRRVLDEFTKRAVPVEIVEVSAPTGYLD